MGFASTVFDADMNAMVGKHCFELVAASKDEKAGHYPPELELLKGKKLLFKVEKSSTRTLRFDDSFRVKRICSDLTIMEDFDAAVDEGDSDHDGDDEVIGEEETVDDTQNEDFVADLIVTPPVTNAEEEFEVSTGQFVPEVINLADESNKGVEIFVPGRLGVDLDKVVSAKRNLSAAFAECADAEASTSKMSKVSQE